MHAFELFIVLYMTECVLPSTMIMWHAKRQKSRSLARNPIELIHNFPSSDYYYHDIKYNCDHVENKHSLCVLHILYSICLHDDFIARPHINIIHTIEFIACLWLSSILQTQEYILYMSVPKWSSAGPVANRPCGASNVQKMTLMIWSWKAFDACEKQEGKSGIVLGALNAEKLSA